VNKLAAFNVRYGAPPAGVQIAGEWEAGDNLGNGQEEVKLSYGAGTPIRIFTYKDVSPWPVDADAGYALVLTNPATVPDHSTGSNWRSSVRLNGQPGSGDATTFAAWAAANSVSDPLTDENNNGLANLTEYALGCSHLMGVPAVLPKAGAAPFFATDYATYSFRRNLAADDVAFIAEISADLQTWYSDPGHVIFVSESQNGDGTSTRLFRSTTPRSSTNCEFFRLRLQPR
jgi:hypothetical protein